MNSRTSKSELKIISECIECGLCYGECSFLSEADVTPVEMALRGIKIEEAFGCSLCGRCEANCPMGLNLAAMFAARRVEAMANGELVPADQFGAFPIETNKNLQLYRHFYGIDSVKLEDGEASSIGFSQGCTILTYSPRLVREAYQLIHEDSLCWEKYIND